MGLNITCSKQILRKCKKNKKKNKKTILLGNLFHTHLFYDVLIFSPLKIEMSKTFSAGEKKIVTVKISINSEIIANQSRILMEKKLVENLILTIYW